MMELVTRSGLSYNNTAEIKNELGFNKIEISSKKLCLIHLSSKWINKYFSEENFINLLDNLKNLKINIYFYVGGNNLFCSSCVEKTIIVFVFGGSLGAPPP